MSKESKMTIDGQGWMKIRWRVAPWTRVHLSLLATPAPAPAPGVQLTATGRVTVGGVSIVHKTWTWRIRPPDSS